ncbi:hypothetical protein KFK09_020937 [Dendrobium nobile]|uniref:Uncharacterized protein n=1 Tax=Dendrobium nobile TaxID=94219 RepID=A0A8T3ANV1_DENNO|nr:hypothetical protein KFK09_020937 [Dendrobium nobile]
MHLLGIKIGMGNTKRPLLPTSNIEKLSSMGSSENKNMYYSLDKEPLEDEDSALMKTVKAATSGFVAGTIWGTVVATWNDVPRVERHVALPGLIRTLKICGNYGLTFAAVGGIYIGVEQLVLKQRVKRDFINGAVGAFVAGASVYGLKGKTIPSALTAGSALAVTSAILDIGGRTTRVDVGKEYYPYTTEKRPSPSPTVS